MHIYTAHPLTLCCHGMVSLSQVASLRSTIEQQRAAIASLSTDEQISKIKCAELQRDKDLLSSDKSYLQKYVYKYERKCSKAIAIASE
jgi:cell division protein FtsB